ncbi:TPA: AAA family ATPase [Klebsiella pneumoniae subsp. pneumoniae]|uniref:AAA family ATPase n=2 Tax=Klebsiella pneumoniae complex TaxID=3390273 RepID=UPI0009BB5694|nr:AAA family ATPase [Klebsiella pneumoniae]HBQ5692234.1 AAA family ATPase [Klebsiella pneumoniae subsp. pneumoniae]MDE4831799.1 AAA family ATPase [Klebsiella pneumoniae]MDP1309219.1 AAA family ATPase [Klebsiella pneumoniae]TMY56212.1 GTPase [Klebsiella pneumoniae]SLW12246.1 5-methylcytosine-specific restriction enzyme with GTPase activity [Klebsiella pneumoniae]
MSKYSWVPVFKKLCIWIAGYENKQKELVQILREIGVDKGLEDELSDGNREPLKVIDPFTFFATFMKYGVIKRTELFAALLKRADLPISAPSDFNGVPNAQPLKVWLFPYEKERSADMVPNLWALFHQMRAGKIDGELFDKILNIPHTGFAKLTECLFYLSPEEYFPVDAQTKHWLKKKGRQLPKENWKSYQELLSWLNSTQQKTYYEISYEAWFENQRGSFSSVVADEYLSNRFPKSRTSTTHLFAYKTDAMRELAFDPGKKPEKKKKIIIFVDKQPTDPGLSKAIAYESKKSRNHHLTTHAPTLAQGNAAWAVEISTLDQLITLCDWYATYPAKDLPAMENKAKLEKNHISLNQILFGPPGTGKTYSTLERAVLLAEPSWYSDLESQKLSTEEHRQRVKNKYDTLCVDKRIAFITFHQSFSYEDFIEGIRAEVAEESQGIKYNIENGIFKDIADRAAKAVAAKDTGLSQSPTIWKISIGRAHEKEMRDRYINAGEARIGWNDIGDLTQAYEQKTQEQQDYWNSLSHPNRSALNAFSSEIKIGDVLLCLKNFETVQAVGIVTSDYSFDEEAAISDEYAHMRKVNWVLKDIDLNIFALNGSRKMVQQTLYPLYRISWHALIAEIDKQHISLPISFHDANNFSERQNYILIIDEINRGNISRIFGELITLLEPDKRLGGADQRSVILPYSKEVFSVPENLYIIGTMNTADKSLAQLDLALRRRFEFVEIMPQPVLLSDLSVFGINVGDLLAVMNQRIEVLLDRDHTLGHAYFWPLKSATTEDEKCKLIADIFAKRIIPLLQEYFFADWERIGWVLNDSEKAPENRFIQTDILEHGIKNLFPTSIASQLNDRRYRINQSAFSNAAAYQGILPNDGVAN